MPPLRSLPFLALILAVGCASPKATFQVTVTNRSASPISIGLVKIGGAIEPAWAGPEHIAARAPRLGDRRWGTLLRPTGTTTLGPLSGTFYRGSKAVLRVYQGDHDMDGLNAFSRTDPGRADIDVLPGISYYVVEDARAGIKVIQADPRQAPPDSERK
jgi:hypothetical protein